MTHSMTDSTMSQALGRFLDVNVARYKLIATNLANIDTPGYKTRDLDFRAELERASTEDWSTDQNFADDNSGSARLVSAGQSAPRQIQGHNVRGLMERPDGNNVSIERESLLLADAQMKYNLGVQLLKDEFHTISLAINSGGTTS